MTDMLCIAIVHYHLRPGGVTTVIKETVRSLRAQGCRVAVLSGTPADVQVPGVNEHERVPGLDYADRSPAVLPETLVENLEATARRSFGRNPDIWHFHNHSLGKNGTLSQAVYLLAGRGLRMLLQIHDFPEDGRPSNYRGLLQQLGEGSSTQWSERLYPQGRRIHYATINRRDCKFLCRAGVEPERVHLLPNAVTLPPVGDPIQPEGKRRLFIYPTRAIRRKNLGEFLLGAALAEKNDWFATTLAPTSAEDRVHYERWIRVAGSLGLPVEFEVGLRSRVPFEELLRSAYAVVTTSVAEGFGLAFLEPWLVERPLLGRDLPELTEGFKEQGLNLGSLYGKFPVPLAWIGAEAVKARIESAMRSMLSSYGREWEEGMLTRAYEAAVEGERVDFGRLDESLQEEVIRRVVRDPACARDLDPFMRDPKSETVQVEANRRLVEREYNGEQYGKRLIQIYDQLMNTEQGAAEALNAESLLDSFLAPERFFLLRS